MGDMCQALAHIFCTVVKSIITPLTSHNVRYRSRHYQHGPPQLPQRAAWPGLRPTRHPIPREKPGPGRRPGGGHIQPARPATPVRQHVCSMRSRPRKGVRPAHLALGSLLPSRSRQALSNPLLLPDLSLQRQPFAKERRRLAAIALGEGDIAKVVYGTLEK